ncbi:MAG: tRNA methyltransferase, has a role in tRNA modification [Lichina confinis]|nr:MAG: tRNA methyltransferase, has a role in tRNA modification [Lichina confinis]
MAELDSQRYEDEHVHRVYEQIAQHFSETRYKPWPLVETFLKNRPVGSVGLDVGCGNGKYLGVNPNVFIVGSDRSPALTRIASGRGYQTVVADLLGLPNPDFRFDFVISVAVVHHLSTQERRVAAIKAILAALKSRHTGAGRAGDSGAEALVYVWALEQRKSRRGWDKGDDQDVMVPWVLKDSQKERMVRGKRPRDYGHVEEASKPYSLSKGPTSASTTVHRFYHLYRAGELEQDVVAAGGFVVESGYEDDNWWAIARRKEP